MAGKALGRRLNGVGLALRPGEPYRFAVVVPEAWPVEVRAAYAAAKAAGDWERLADVVEARVGVRPTFPRAGEAARHRTPPLIEIRSRPDGPR